MSVKKLSNISIKEFRKFLRLAGCKKIRTKGGHEIWSRGGTDDTRSITFQTHINPVPKFIIVNNLSDLNYTKDDFFDILGKKRKVVSVQRNKKVIYMFENELKKEQEHK